MKKISFIFLTIFLFIPLVVKAEISEETTDIKEVDSSKTEVINIIEDHDKNIIIGGNTLTKINNSKEFVCSYPIEEGVSLAMDVDDENNLFVITATADNEYMDSFNTIGAIVKRDYHLYKFSSDCSLIFKIEITTDNGFVEKVDNLKVHNNEVYIIETKVEDITYNSKDEYRYYDSNNVMYITKYSQEGEKVFSTYYYSIPKQFPTYPDASYFNYQTIDYYGEIVFLEDYLVVGAKGLAIIGYDGSLIKTYSNNDLTITGIAERENDTLIAVGNNISNGQSFYGIFDKDLNQIDLIYLNNNEQLMGIKKSKDGYFTLSTTIVDNNIVNSILFVDKTFNIINKKDINSNVPIKFNNYQVVDYDNNKIVLVDYLADTTSIGYYWFAYQIIEKELNIEVSNIEQIKSLFDIFDNLTDEEYSSLVWINDNENIINVDNDQIKGLSKGNGHLKTTYKDKQLSLRVSVIDAISQETTTSSNNNYRFIAYIIIAFFIALPFIGYKRVKELNRI